MLRHDFVQDTLWSSFLPLSKYFLEAISNLSFLLQISFEVKIYFSDECFSLCHQVICQKMSETFLDFLAIFFQSPIA